MNREQIMDTISQVADLLYQGNTEYAYRMLVLIIPELEQLISSIGKSEIQEELRTKLMSALQAMEAADYVLLADILQYEIVEYMQELMNE